MPRALKFGGPNLQEGQHTWYELAIPVERHGRTYRKGYQLNAYPGEIVPVEEVRNPEYYVQTGRASYVGDVHVNEEEETAAEAS